ncbi:reverse transcriptase domain-containing protein [Tanacetum coccineum]
MEVLTEREITDKLSDEHLMVLKSKFNNDEPWYADFVNYIVGKVVPPNWTFEKRKRFFLQVKTYFWEEPYVFKLCTDNIMRRCVAGSETLKILAHCHSGPTSGHHIASVMEKKVYEFGFYWHSVFKDANEYGLDFMGAFPESRGNKYISVAVDYVSKWVEAQALPTNDARVVVKFLRSLFARTAYKTPTGCTPFRLVYGKECHLPIEIEHKAHWALKQCNMDLTLASESRLMQLNELAKLRDGAYENTRIYKERTKKWHNSRLRGDKDFKSGPNTVKTVYPHGAIEITNMDEFSFKVNGQRLKKYYRGNINKDDDKVLEFENGVTLPIRQPYTPSFDPQGDVYEDLSNQKRLMRADKLDKFSDGTLKSVRDTLQHRLCNFRLGYNKDMPRRNWPAMD